MQAHAYQAPGANLEVESVFCRNCGSPITATAQTCSHCSANQNLNPRSKITAGLLALFLGGLGFHRFYLGQWWGLFYLLFWGTGIPSLISLIEAIVFFCTSDQKWNAKYGRTKGSAWLMGLAGVFAILVMIGTLSAIAIPAYQKYVERAKAAQASMQQQAEPQLRQQ
ncbi:MULTISPECIES: NINE protein [Pseudomonas]|uniref:TM2 domain-containing membrane protein YozV n=1 Tax=Phytopseudomonas flavescens TaxID=29435 RepID=A0A7Y9XNK0_9GAMM|nr:MULTISPECIES: NINE protein [Pseudomonas]MCW2290833.1 TM2 domain-containing membrane protein YozV [Pseudomonas sp. BIGb0408]NYH74595.1 TM2 domain-containing membrane protein YozV [Pseudomonas flavescens]